MAKTKNIRGVPGNLALSYLSTMGYYENGYMGDWVMKTFKNLDIIKIKVDILNDMIYPKEANIRPLLSNLSKLRSILKNELMNHGFEMNFIIRAEMNFEKLDENMLKCYPILEDKNGKAYYPKKPIIEYCCEIK